MTPWEDLADHWRTLGVLQVYDSMTEQLDVPFELCLGDLRLQLRLQRTAADEAPGEIDPAHP